MFLWDGSNCWSEDVDGDGLLDIDGDFDTDIVLHEFHHGVSHRLNTSFNGAEADAIGEGGSDFFAYSINGDTNLAEYSRPGGLRTINGKGYNDWTCLLGLFCEPHDNGEIWANVLWDLRERFRHDLVRGSEGAAINEVHQIYVDGLKLSASSPTMLDLRDAMMEADAIRNPGTPEGPNFCALWETFAGRGMGLNASDTAANGFNQVIANFSVPPGCNAPPSPPAVTLTVTNATATEAGPTNGIFTITRAEVSQTALMVNVATSGTAARGSDYVTIPSGVTIPPGAASVDVPVVPIDDTNLEGNETVGLTLRSGSGYVIGGTPSGTVTIISDDVAPDLTVSALTVPSTAGAGLTMTVTDTTRNQGTGPVAASTTSFYLSTNGTLDAGDTFVGSRDVPALTNWHNRYDHYSVDPSDRHRRRPDVADRESRRPQRVQRAERNQQYALWLRSRRPGPRNLGADGASSRGSRHNRQYHRYDSQFGRRQRRHLVNTLLFVHQLLPRRNGRGAGVAQCCRA